MDVYWGLMPLQRKLVQQLEESLNSKLQKPFGLIVIDIFDFHEFVLDYGFNTVSELSDRVHRRLTALTSDWAENYIVGRSTFAVTLNEQDDPKQIADRLLDYLNRPYLINGLIVNLKTSIGMAVDPTHSLSSFDLLDNACTASRQAEIDRFKSVYLFEPEMENHRVQHRKIRTDLRKAVSQISPHADHMFKTSSFEVVYQPKVDLSTRKLLGFEALLRWQHPIYGPVSPEIFIPICEEIGLINVLGGWVIQIACQDAGQWPLSSDQKRLTVAVNLSPAQLSDRDLLLTSISSAIESSNINPEDLEFELTERDFHDTFLDVINEIKAKGCKLSIDDFGVKYSSLACPLKSDPFPKLEFWLFCA
jgi:predicted signal transduction protein with EAL and GGDEF domain